MSEDRFVNYLMFALVAYGFVAITVLLLLAIVAAARSCFA